MKSLNIISILLILILSACKNDKKVAWNEDFATSKIQKFEIEVGKSTEIRCKNGTILTIDPQTFQTSSKKFILEVKEALNIGDMITFGLTTVTENNQLLETNGMIKVSAQAGTEVKINPDFPIKVKMPIKFANPNTNLYIEGSKTSNSFLWKEISKIDNTLILNEIEKGQSLFTKKCEACHHKDLVSTLTGPALGNIHKTRTLDWFTKFTRNSQQMIMDGDPIACCVWNRFKPTVMNAFPKLSKEDCKAIYTFIQNKSEQNKIELKRYDCLYDPNVVGDTSSLYYIENGKSKAYIWPANTTSAPAFYDFEIKKFEWLNCDSPIPNGSNVKINIDFDKSLTRKFKDSWDRMPDTYLIYTNKNILYHWYGNENVTILKGQAILISINSDGEKYYFSQQNIDIQDVNNWKLDIQEISKADLQKKLNSL
jgi:cytochrome c2